MSKRQGKKVITLPRLTSLGKTISNEIEASDWAKAEMDYSGLWHSIGDSPPYDVQEISFRYMEEFKPSDDFYRKWKESAYKHGIDINQVKHVLAIELRDALFEYQKENGIYNLSFARDSL